jgi:hypothetical protein
MGSTRAGSGMPVGTVTTTPKLGGTKEDNMGIGASVFLIAVGAILTFAVRDTTLGGWINLDAVGWILMIAGALGLIVTMVIWGNRRRTVVEGPTRTTYERRTIDDDL